MAISSYQDIPFELKHLFNKSLQQSSRYVYGSSSSLPSHTSRKKKYILARRSKLTYIASIWKTLPPNIKTLWKSVGKENNTSGWVLFLVSATLAIKEQREILIEPSLYWQGKVGKIDMPFANSKIHLVQRHYNNYWESVKVRGKYPMQQTAYLTERFTLPLDFSISYKSTLSPLDDESFASVYLEVGTKYQGQDYIEFFPIFFSVFDDWHRVALSVEGLRGILMYYNVNILISGYTGSLMLDNLFIEHQSTNFARDPFFSDMRKQFKGVFSVVSPYWEIVAKENGAFYSSVYGDI